MEDDLSGSTWSACHKAADNLKAWEAAPRVAVVLGSGLGGFAERLTDAKTLGYDDIPHFPSTGVSGHAGTLVLGHVGDGGPPVVALCGRAPLYEGHGPAPVVPAPAPSRPEFRDPRSNITRHFMRL